MDDAYRARLAGAHRCRETRSEPIIYRDRGQAPHYRTTHLYEYSDSHARRCHRLIWPGYSCRIYYPWYQGARVVTFFPYYHRKYVFVSLGGFWPAGCSYRRYYWYGYHPYAWYGYSPVPQELRSNTYNIYTYNYYGPATAATSPEATVADTAPAVPQAVPPADGADELFAAGVAAFEQGQFVMAATSFQQAMALSPEDVVLPFAYAQALFADGRYEDAVSVLRMILAPTASGMPPAVLYPRGLYPDEETLLTQIDDFMTLAEAEPGKASYRLLLGYHLLGIGETALARGYLLEAQADPVTAPAAQVLLTFADRLEAEGKETGHGPR